MFTGLTRGLQLIADWGKLFVAAVEKYVAAVADGNAADQALYLGAITALSGVASTWLSETVNAAGSVKLSLINFMWGADPYRESRAQFEPLQTKWASLL